MVKPLTATIKQRNGTIAISDAPLKVQGEYFAIDMPLETAVFLWDAQKSEVTIESTSEQIGNFTAICTNYIPLQGDDNMARAFFVRTEFLPQV